MQKPVKNWEKKKLNNTFKVMSFTKLCDLLKTTEESIHDDDIEDAYYSFGGGGMWSYFAKTTKYRDIAEVIMKKYNVYIVDGIDLKLNPEDIEY